MLSVQIFGPGGTLLKYRSRIFWIDGPRTRAAAKAPQRKRPCRSRATARRSLLPPSFGYKTTYAHWSTAAGFWLRRGNGHDRTPVAPHYAFFPSYKEAGFHHASQRRSSVAARGAGAAARDAGGWIDQRWGSRTRRLPCDRLSAGSE